MLIHKFKERTSKSKYKNVRVEVDGFKFDSKAEARYYGELKLRQIAGDIKYFLRQVPFHLPGNIVYRCDFSVFENNGDIRYIDVKGVITDKYKMKKKLVEALYPIKIEEVFNA